MWYTVYNDCDIQFIMRKSNNIRDLQSPCRISASKVNSIWYQSVISKEYIATEDKSQQGYDECCGGNVRVSNIGIGDGVCNYECYRGGYL